MRCNDCEEPGTMLSRAQNPLTLGVGQSCPEGYKGSPPPNIDIGLLYMSFCFLSLEMTGSRVPHMKVSCRRDSIIDHQVRGEVARSVLRAPCNRLFRHSVVQWSPLWVPPFCFLVPMGPMVTSKACRCLEGNEEMREMRKP